MSLTDTTDTTQTFAISFELDLKHGPAKVWRALTDPVLLNEWLLTPTASGTLLSIVQSGFKPDQKHNFGGARYGWKMMGEKLIAILDAT